MSQPNPEPVARLANDSARRLTPIVTAILTALILARVFQVGLYRGMDHVVAFGPEIDQVPIVIALSDVVYHLDAGYVGHASVYKALADVWNGGAVLATDPIFQRTRTDRRVLNAAIAAASSLGPQQTGFISDGRLMTAVYEDLGYVDFVKLGFRLFGLNIESRYYMFFVVLSISAAAFLVAFRSQVTAQVLLLCLVFAFYVEIQTGIFEMHLSMPSLAEAHHLSALALLPMWHLSLALVYRQRLSAATLLTSLVQIAILSLAIATRRSAGWTVMYLTALALVLGVAAWRRRPPGAPPWSTFVRETARWPLLLVIGGLLVHAQYMNARLHPVYFTDDVLPYHGGWHNAVLGLIRYDPAWFTEIDSDHRQVSPSPDHDGIMLALDYVKKAHFIASEAGYLSPWTGIHKYALHDRIMQRVFWSMIFSHPLRAARIYLEAKPREMAGLLLRLLRNIRPKIWLLLVIEPFVLCGLAFASRAWRDVDEAGAARLAFTAALFAVLPNLWAYPLPHAAGDLLLSVIILMQVALWAIVMRTTRRVLAVV
jgi:hypothetical protein